MPGGSLGVATPQTGPLSGVFRNWQGLCCQPWDTQETGEEGAAGHPLWPWGCGDTLCTADGWSWLVLAGPGWSGDQLCWECLPQRFPWEERVSP